MMDYETCSGRLSLEFREQAADGEVEIERQDLQAGTLVLRGPKTTRGLPGPSAQLGTLSGQPERFRPLLSARQVEDQFGERIPRGRLTVTWVMPRKQRGKPVHTTLVVNAKPAVLWRLYKRICEAQDRTPDSSFRPNGVAVEKVGAPKYNLSDRIAKAQEMKGFLRSPKPTAVFGAGGAGGRPSQGARLQAAVQAKQRRASQTLQQRQLEAMVRPTGDRLPEARVGRRRHDVGFDDDDENLMPDSTFNSSADSRRRRPSGNPVHSGSQLGIQASFRRSGASAFYGAYRQDGLTNLGNTCYMSAILQALLRLPSFVHDLRTCTERLRADGEDIRTGTSLFAELLDVVKGLHGEQSVFNPKKLKDCISRRSPQFAGNAQQDAHEFLTDILDFMQVELRHSRRKHSPESAAATDVHPPPICPTALNFRCVIEHRHVCCECGGESKKRELHHDLSLDLPRSNDPQDRRDTSAVPIQQLFDGYFAAETIEKTCETCGADTAVVHKALVTLPRVLVLHLKRFDTKLMPAQTLEDGTRVEPRWVAIKRPDLVKLDNAIDVRGQCAADVRVAIPSSHTSRDLTRARAAPTAPHSAIKPRKQPLALSSSSGNSAEAHRDRDRRSPSAPSLSGGLRSFQCRKAQEEEQLAKAIAASLQDVKPAAEANSTEKRGAGHGHSEDAIDVEDEHNQYVRAVEESLNSAPATSLVESNDGEPAAKRTRSDSPPGSSGAAAAAAVPFTSEKLEAWETSAVEPWLSTMGVAETNATGGAVRHRGHTRYELHGVVSHFGSHADVGHYTTTIKLAPPTQPKKQFSASAACEIQSEPYRGKWREYNDSTSTDNTVERMINSERKQKHAYLAIYVLSNSLEPVDDGRRRQAKRKNSVSDGDADGRNSSSTRFDLTSATACDLTGTTDDDMKGDTEEDDPIEGEGDGSSGQGGDLFEDQPLQSRSPLQSEPSRPRSKADLSHLLNAAATAQEDVSDSRFDDDMQRALRLSMSEK